MTPEEQAEVARAAEVAENVRRYGNDHARQHGGFVDAVCLAPSPQRMPSLSCWRSLAHNDHDDTTHRAPDGREWGDDER